MSELKQLDSLNPQAAQLVEPFADELLQIEPANIIAVIVYGSATGVNFIKGRSNINLLIVLRQLGFIHLKGYQKLIYKAKKKKIVAPLFLTKEHILSSLDVFPIEFWEMKDNYVIIYGEDVFSDIYIDPADLRMQCERELKSRLIHIRQGYLEAAEKSGWLKLLLEESLSSVLPIMRNIIRLYGKRPPVKKEDIIERIKVEFNLSDSPFLDILKLKEKNKPPSKEILEAILNDYLQQIQQLAKVVDKLQIN